MIHSFFIHPCCLRCHLFFVVVLFWTFFVPRGSFIFSDHGVTPQLQATELTPFLRDSEREGGEYTRTPPPPLFPLARYVGFFFGKWHPAPAAGWVCSRGKQQLREQRNEEDEEDVRYNFGKVICYNTQQP